MRCPLLLLTIPWTAHAIVAQERSGNRPGLRVVAGVTSDGNATDQWIAMLRRRLPEAKLRAFVQLIRLPTPRDQAWMTLIRSRAAFWQSEIPLVARPFHPVEPPMEVTVVVGNRGGEDAFTHDPTTIGFDVAALQASYGDADAPENEDRLDRFFRHEYTHLMQKAWRRVHPHDAGTPLEKALADIWAEGLGNYYSLSARWRAAGAEPSSTAADALEDLAPRFVARIAALACATSEDAARLTADLSWGRFDRKWGALPAALWLEREATESHDALRAFVLAGPEAVWALAERNVPEPLAAVLDEAREAAALCRSAATR